MLPREFLESFLGRFLERYELGTFECGSLEPNICHFPRITRELSTTPSILDTYVFIVYNESFLLFDSGFSSIWILIWLCFGWCALTKIWGILKTLVFAQVSTSSIFITRVVFQKLNSRWLPVTTPVISDLFVCRTILKSSKNFILNITA